MISHFSTHLGRLAVAVSTWCTLTVTCPGQGHSLTQSQTFVYTGSLQTFAVPAGVSELHIRAFGARGGFYRNNSLGGRGGSVAANVPVTPGSTLQILVGGRGSDATSLGGAGGGGTFIAAGGNFLAFANPLVVAGGGGGAAVGSSTCHGQSGGSTGGNGSGGAGDLAGGGGGAVGDGGGRWSLGGASAVNGGAGGNGGLSLGGYGGGGATSGNAGAGGGGYGGGAGGNWTWFTSCQQERGQGGTSYVTATANSVSYVPGGNNLADGRVVLTWAPGETFDYTGGLQTYTVPGGVTGLTLLATGGAGGDAVGAVGGRGGRIKATIDVTPGQQLVFLVGGGGGDTTNDHAGGGGGATYVALGASYAAFATPLLVAGGGGGASRPGASGFGPGGHGGVLLGGSGLGGTGAPTLRGAGGGGIVGHGGLGYFAYGWGSAAINGGAGGPSHVNAQGGYGGYGGGGGAGEEYAPGGGGHTGGNGASTTVNSNGGSSFAAAAATNVANAHGMNGEGHGWFTIVPLYMMASVAVTPGTVGCGAQPLTIVAQTGSLPKLGNQFDADIDNVPVTAAFTAVGLGLSTTMAGPTPLPFALSGLGAPGCSIYNDMLLGPFNLAMPSGATSATYSYSVPSQPALVGLPLHLQAWCPVSGINALGLVTSNDLELVFGY